VFSGPECRRRFGRLRGAPVPRQTCPLLLGLIPFPAIAVSLFIVALFREQNQPKIVFNFQLINFGCFAAPLALSVLAALRPNRKWLFGIAWLFNFLLYAFFVFAFVFMKGFS
jgi:hypothetical protein